MIYLIAQMFVALALAGILGAAIGWLIHRASYARRLDDHRHALARAHNQIAQAESDVSMLSDDYDELERRSKSEIAALRQENQQIPFLNTNLEKSQLLVRQMMQKHEAKVRDLSAENQALSSRLKSITDREQAYTKVKVELDNIRKQKTLEAQQLRSSEDDYADSDDDSELDLDDSASEPLELLDATIVSSPAEELINSLNKASEVAISNARSNESWASAPIEINADSLDSEEDPVSAVNQDFDMLDSEEESENDLEEFAFDADELIDEDDDNEDPFDEVMEVGDELQRELDIDASDDPLLDGSNDNTSLFEPVEHRDDLKQIFGIGPVTEKALNELGITSYAQLAELKSHEIEKIAGALSIVPGRIERDDWVGNARRQLEDVLEEL